MKKALLFLIVLPLLFLSSCNTQDQYTGVWNKDMNAQYDKVAFPDFRKKGVTIPVDTNLVKSPVFVRIKKRGNYYELSCFLYESGRRGILPDESVLGFVKFTTFDDYQLISDNSASHMNTLTKVVLRFDPGTHELFFKFPFDQSQLPEDKKIRAMFNSMFASGFHKVADIHNKYETTGEIQKQLIEKKVIYE